MAKFREYNQKQGMFLTLIPDELLETTHPAKIVDIIVEKLNLDKIYAYYKEKGNIAYHPKMMIKILFYGYQQGLFSGRKVENNLKLKADFIFLSGGEIPDFRTLNLFRVRHKEELPDLFSQIVLMCNELGMIDLKYFAVDGQKIQGNASFRKNYNKKRLKKTYDKIRNGIKKLLEKEITEDFTEETQKKRVSILENKIEKLDQLQKELESLNDEDVSINMTDKDAKIMKHKDRKSVPSYNHQSGVDEKYGITVCVQTTQANDKPEDLFNILDKIENTMGQKVKNALGDCGFADYEHLEKMENEREEEFYVPDKLFSSSKKDNTEKKYYNKKRFKKNNDGNYYCVDDKKMYVKSIRNFEDGHTETIYVCKDCVNCKLRGKCTKSQARTITIDSREPYREIMREKLKSDKGREIYMKRQGIVEVGHGNDQKNKGWKQHYLRGLNKCSLEFMLIRIGSNLSKIIKYKAMEMLSLT